MDSPATRVLIADDQNDVLEALRLLLKRQRFELQTVSSPREVLGRLQESEFDVILIDLNYTQDTTSGLEGLDLLSQIQRLDSTLPVVVMTAWGSVELAVEAMRRGARDFVTKPWDNERLISILRVQGELAQALRRERRLQLENEILKSPAGAPELIAQADSMQPVLEIISRVGPSDANVLITGENGTGKSLIAEILHSVSGRQGGPMVTVNISGLSEGLFESELFGHVKGAFTDAKKDRVGRFELADGGTLFLDEIANVPMPQQTRLLRVLETGEFERVGSSRTQRADVRIISATNADLDEEIAQERFRQDLLFRLNTVEVKMPPLRERGPDIPRLATYFLAQNCKRYRKQLKGFDSSALETMKRHRWPGNIRELQHAVERSVLMARDNVIRASDLGLHSARSDGVNLEEMTLDEAERYLLKRALARHEGNVSHAAEALGLSRSALYRRLERYDL